MLCQACIPSIRDKMRTREMCMYITRGVRLKNAYILLITAVEHKQIRIITITSLNNPPIKRTITTN